MTPPGKLAFVARRYHSNQGPLIAELAQLGWQITFFAEYVGRSEDHSVVVPQVIGRARRLLPPFDFQPSRFSVLSYGATRRILAERPDIAIIRDFTIASLLLSWRLRAAGIHVVLYTQQPFRTERYGWRQRLYHRLFARHVITPTDQYRAPGESPLPLRARNGPAPTWHFLPFVARPTSDPQPGSAGRGRDGTIRILTIGKFTPRKKLVEWIRLVARLQSEGLDIALTIAGAPLDAETLARARQEIAHLPGSSILIDHPYDAMPGLYAAHDLFVLPSVAEPASVSQLEAMAHGLPVICSNDNGTACYIEHGVTGYVFDARDWERSLTNEVRKACRAIVAGDPIGARGRAAVARAHSVEPWHAFLRKMLTAPSHRNRQGTGPAGDRL